MNNLRDIDDDRVSGKRTLAVRLGESKARLLLLVTYAIPVALVVLASIGPLVLTFIDLVRSWFGSNCQTSYSIPACPAGGGDCSSQPVAQTQCSTPSLPAFGFWLLAVGGVLLVVVAVLLFRAITRRRFGPALPLSSISVVLFAIVLSYGALSYVIPFTYGVSTAAIAVSH